MFILSTIATSSIEEIAEAAPGVIRWFQLYIYKDREVSFRSGPLTRVVATQENLAYLYVII